MTPYNAQSTNQLTPYNSLTTNQLTPYIAQSANQLTPFIAQLTNEEAPFSLVVYLFAIMIPQYKSCWHKKDVEKRKEDGYYIAYKLLFKYAEKVILF